ncbi:MAG TPA: YciI family protein [Kofleriaceae bacterium]|nr:YciI family protein [Kofleriaceae bacterium]
MKFLVLTKATPNSEAGVFPEEKYMMEMMRFNEELVKAGVLLDAGGLYPSSQGKRIRVTGKTAQVTDGPFAETKELIAGYWMMQATSIDEVMAWMKRCPAMEQDGTELEIRRLIDAGDFPELGEQVNAMHQHLEDQVKR